MAVAVLHGEDSTAFVYRSVHVFTMRPSYSRMLTCQDTLMSAALRLFLDGCAGFWSAGWDPSSPAASLSGTLKAA